MSAMQHLYGLQQSTELEPLSLQRGFLHVCVSIFFFLVYFLFTVLSAFVFLFGHFYPLSIFLTVNHGS